MDFAAAVPQRSTPSREELCQLFVGKTIREVPKPAAIMDIAVARRNCAAVDEAVAALGVGFRAHVKTHKVRPRRLRAEPGFSRYAVQNERQLTMDNTDSRTHPDADPEPRSGPAGQSGRFDPRRA